MDHVSDSAAEDGSVPAAGHLGDGDSAGAAWDPFAATPGPARPMSDPLFDPLSGPERLSLHPTTPPPDAPEDKSAGGRGTPSLPAVPVPGDASYTATRRARRELAHLDPNRSDSSNGEARERAARRNWAFVDLDQEGIELPADALALLKGTVAREYNVLPIGLDGRRIQIAVPDPDDAVLADALRAHLAGYTMARVYAEPRAIRRQIERWYSTHDEAARIARESAAKRRATATPAGDGFDDMGRIADSRGSDTTQILRLTIEQALRDGASDIHIEPTKHDVIVRFVVDGKGMIYNRLADFYGESLLTKIKVDARMETGNFLRPDSGVLQFERPHQEPVDIRVEIAPTVHGSTCTMRLQQNIWRPLDGLGFSAYNMERFRRALAQPYGIILLTGPTGSGKSTTNYSAVREMISPTRKIITLENPVEYQVPEGVTQISVNEGQGMTFASGLRSILRQAPNTILVGEIRDRETAEVAIDAAMTGHQLFSTVHTNDASEVTTRLLRMGIEPFMLASSLLSTVGQRLVPRLCPSCRVEHFASPEEITAAGFDPDQADTHLLYAANPEGCNDCRNGIAGRLPIHEVLLVTEDLSDAVAANATTPTVRRLAAEGGMTTLRQDGWEKVQQGLISLHHLNEATRRSF